MLLPSDTSPRTDMVPLTTLQQLQEQVISTIHGMWAESTWFGRQRLFFRFTEFCQEHGMHDLQECADWAVPLFVESTGVAVTAKLTYAKSLAALLHRMGTATPVLQFYQAALRSTGGMIPMHQAVPASGTQIDRMLARASAVGPRLEAAIFIAWKTASRWDDVASLVGASFLLVEANEIIIAWLDRTKTTRSDPFRPSSWVVIHHPAPMTAIAATLRNLEPNESLIDWTTNDVIAWMHRDPDTSQLTAHSFKRGALEYLATCVIDGQMPMELLPILAKHKAVLDFPSTTLRYIGNRVTLARMLRTQQATVLLPCAPRLDEPPEPLIQTQPLTQPERPQRESIRDRVEQRRWESAARR